MTAYFNKSRMTARVGGAISAAAGFSAAFFLLAGRLSVFQRFAVSFAVSFAAVNTVLYIARLVAIREYQDRLCRLYNDLNPTDFLDGMLPLTEIKTDISTHTITLVHIANGYLASGKSEKAQTLLRSIALPDHAVELRGLVLSNLVSCCLQQEDCGTAQKIMNELKLLITDKRCKPRMSKKIRHALAYQTICMHVLQGNNSDCGRLEKDFMSSRNPLHRVNVQLQLARIYLRLGDLNKFDDARQYILEHGKHMYESSLIHSLGGSVSVD